MAYQSILANPIRITALKMILHESFQDDYTWTKPQEYVNMNVKPVVVNIEGYNDEDQFGAWPTEVFVNTHGEVFQYINDYENYFYCGTLDGQMVFTQYDPDGDDEEDEE